jgi:predicted DNA-binding transcriptional regulator AlpA
MTPQLEQDTTLKPLMSAAEFSETVSLSARSIWRLHSAGKLPAPVRIGGSVRWRRDEVLDWIAAGCPDRKTWERSRRS